MTGIRRTPSIGKILAAGALFGLVGCHQVPSQSNLFSARGGGQAPDGGGGAITPAQEADVQISLGRVAEKGGDLEQAMAAYRAALSRDGRRADAYRRLAVLHDKQGKFRESAELYGKALALQSGDPDIFCDMGYSLYLQRRWAESESNLRQAIAVSPQHPRAHNNLALLLARDGRTEDALAEFRKAGSSPAESHMNLAFALTMERRWEPARAEYQRALALDPSSQLAKDRLGQLNALLAKMDKPRDGTRQQSRLLTTSTDAPPRCDVPQPNAITAPASGTPEAARPPAVRDTGVVPTVAKIDPPRRHTRDGLSTLRLPVQDDAMQQLWATVDPPAAAAPRPRPDNGLDGARMASREGRAPEPCTRIPRPEDSTSGSLPATKAPAPPKGPIPKRTKIPPPRPAGAIMTTRPGTAERAGSQSTTTARPVRVPPPVPPPANLTSRSAPPVMPGETMRDMGPPPTPPAPELPLFQSIP